MGDLYEEYVDYAWPDNTELNGGDIKAAGAYGEPSLIAHP